jgi:hypothetical protein
VLCCLAKPPDERFASMIELQAALGALAVDAEAAEPAVEAPARTVPLGRGFRSVYDANLAAAIGGSSVFRPGSPVPDALRARLTFAPPRAAVPDGDDDDDDDGNGELAPRSRAGVRAALACVLVVGVAAGLIATPLIAGEDRTPSATPGDVRAAPLRLEAAPAEPPGEPTTAPDRPGRGGVVSAIAAPAAASAADAEEPSPSPAVASVADAEEPSLAPAAASAADAEESSPARTDESPPPRHSSSKAAAPRHRMSAEPRAGRAQVSGPRTSWTSAASGPVRSPADLEPTRPARSAPAAAPPPSASAPPPSAPAAAPSLSAASPSSAIAASPPARPAPPPARPAPPPPTEDLYDTR